MTLPQVKNWMDTLPDFSRLVFKTSVVSFMHEALQKRYEESRRRWRERVGVVEVNA